LAALSVDNLSARPIPADLTAMDAAARDLGLVPGDPAYAFFCGLRRMFSDQQDRFDALESRLTAVVDTAEKQASGAIAFRALGDLPAAIDRAILGRARMWTTGIAAAVLIVGFGAGVLEGWELFHPPAKLTCQVEHGGYVCFAWIRPATEPVQQSQVGQPEQPQATQATRKSR
jgi:hypothetical protein